MENFNSASDEALSQPDLRVELLANLALQFATEIEANIVIPSTVKEALLDLLDGELPTSAEIIQALSKNCGDNAERSNA